LIPTLLISACVATSRKRTFTMIKKNLATTATANASTASEYIPIRELSGRTGVNSVTIRAWERRYGLLKPVRTDKGHRLYSPADVEIIHKVQRHLEQGIAISKIKSLIYQSTSVTTDENWITHGEKLLAIINALNINKLENYLYELTGNYPPHILWRHLIQPLNNELRKFNDDYGTQSKQLLLVNGVQKQAQLFIKSQSREAKENVLIIGLDESAIPLESFFLAMEITAGGLKPILDFYLAPLSEVPFIAHEMKPDTIILHGNGTLTKQFVTREITARLGKLGLPFFVTGNAAIINEALLSAQKIEHHADLQGLINRVTNRLTSHG